MTPRQFPHRARALRAAEQTHWPIMPQTGRWRAGRLRIGLLLFLALPSTLVVPADSPAEELAFEEIRLPPLRIQGQTVRAHMQGLELVAGKCFVTARQDDVRPKRALLLRSDPTASAWDVWDITPLDAQGAITAQDHPGGIQSDGTRLWIPVAESNRTGRSLIRAYKLADMTAGGRLKADFEFAVNDHIGALAVAAESKLLFGANWDTERVYVWDFKGRLQRMLTDVEPEITRAGSDKWRRRPPGPRRPRLEGRRGAVLCFGSFPRTFRIANGGHRKPPNLVRGLSGTGIPVLDCYVAQAERHHAGARRHGGFGRPDSFSARGFGDLQSPVPDPVADLTQRGAARP